MTIISVYIITFCVSKATNLPFGLRAMSKCTEPTNGQTETEQTHNGIYSKSFSDVHSVDNHTSQMKGHEGAHESKKGCVPDISSLPTSKVLDDLTSKVNSDSSSKKRYWPKRPLSIPSLKAGRKSCEADAEKTTKSIKEKLRYLQSSIDCSKSKKSPGSKTADLNSETLKDEKSPILQDTSINNETSSDGNVV